jgi:hypothetical protein
LPRVHLHARAPLPKSKLQMDEAKDKEALESIGLANAKLVMPAAQ